MQRYTIVLFESSACFAGPAVVANLKKPQNNTIHCASPLDNVKVGKREREVREKGREEPAAECLHVSIRQ